jgi:hypothetical protein
LSDTVKSAAEVPEFTSTCSYKGIGSPTVVNSWSLNQQAILSRAQRARVVSRKLGLVVAHKEKKVSPIRQKRRPAIAILGVAPAQFCNLLRCAAIRRYFVKSRIRRGREQDGPIRAPSSAPAPRRAEDDGSWTDFPIPFPVFPASSAISLCKFRIFGGGSASPWSLRFPFLCLPAVISSLYCLVSLLLPTSPQSFQANQREFP